MVVDYHARLLEICRNAAEVSDRANLAIIGARRQIARVEEVLANLAAMRTQVPGKIPGRLRPVPERP